MLLITQNGCDSVSLPTPRVKSSREVDNHGNRAGHQSSLLRPPTFLGFYYDSRASGRRMLGMEEKQMANLLGINGREKWREIYLVPTVAADPIP